MSYDKESIAQSFDQLAANFEANALLQQEVASRLFERLELMNVSPKNVLDAGCGTGYCSRILKKRYPKSKITAIDLSLGMIEQAKSLNGFFSKVDYQVADIEQLPFDTNSFDVVFSNMAVHWLKDQKKLFVELNRVLKPGGLLIFSTLGPDTLIELSETWQQIDDNTRLWNFYDMHIIGDHVYNASFDNTVIDRDVITLTYKTFKGLINDLKSVGARKLLVPSRTPLTKFRWQKLKQTYNQFRWDDGQLPLTTEVVYGHAWKKMQPAKGDYHTYSVEIKN